MAKRHELESGTPLLAGFIDSDDDGNQLNVWCMFCVKWHYHGCPTTEDEGAHIGLITHRVAHCYMPWSPYKRTGYYIEITDIPFSCVEKSVKLANTRQLEIMQKGRTTPAIDRLHLQDGPRRATNCSAIATIPGPSPRELRRRRLALRRSLEGQTPLQ